MAKYNTEFKKIVIKEYLESRNSYKYLSDKYGIPTTSVIRIWGKDFR